MPFTDKGTNEDSEVFVEPLSSTDIDQLAQFSHELHLSSEMETEDSEVVIESVEESVAEEVVQTDIGAQEVVIETEPVPSPEEMIPDVKTKTSNLPPLRPLTIAPKPAKVPIAIKPMAGQQLLFVQGTGSNQAIKLVSSQGQELNFTNLSLGRPIAVKPTIKTVPTSQGNIGLAQPKQVLMKKFVPSGLKTAKTTTAFANKQGHIMVVQKAEQVKLLPNQNTLSSPTKTITLQQAQDMGLIATTKVLPQAQSTPKQHTMLLNKAGSKTIKIVPQLSPTQIVGQKTFTTTNQLKSPTKILPATQVTSANKAPQRFIFKSAAGTGHTILPSAQIIQVAGTQGINTGQLHQINIPGKGMQYIKFVTASSAETLQPTASTITTIKNSSQSTATNIVFSEIKPLSTTAAIAPKPLKNIAAKTSITPSQLVMLPTFVQSQLNSKVPIPMKHTPIAAKQVSPDNTASSQSTDTSLDSNGMRPRKPCNCTKSQCLKLYCDCFANGEFCYMCNCMNCYNNLENEDNRQRAIKTCLERNPNAFRPKIGKAKDLTGDSSIRKHTKGCNCKRSGCLKNYCECYEAKIACSNNCKCVGCRNIEDSLDKKSLRLSLDDSYNAEPINKIAPNKDSLQFRTRRASSSKQAINYFITEDVIEAMSQCMLTISESSEANSQDEEITKSQIIQEFGRCLKEVIDCSMNN